MKVTGRVNLPGFLSELNRHLPFSQFPFFAPFHLWCRNAYNLVLHKKGDMLYTNLQTVISDHLQKKASVITKTNEAEFLSCVQRAWDAHMISMQMIRDILMYMVGSSLSPFLAA